MPHANPPTPGATPEQLNPDLTPTPETNSVSAAPSAPAADAAAAVQYRESVENLMVNESPLMISNSQPAHAAILFEKFFQHAKREIRIFSWNLSACVFGNSDVLRQVRAAILRGVKISVITQKPPEESPFLALLRASPDATVACADGSANAQLQTAAASPVTFAVMDERAIRVEQDHTTMKAQAAMNRPEAAKKLSVYFDGLLARLRASTVTPVHT